MRILDFFKRNPSNREAGSGPEPCCLCDHPLSGGIVLDSWGQRAHSGHTIRFCGSCDRILSKKTSAGAYRYSDGRYVCGFCKKLAVTDGVTANRSRRRVQELLEGKGFSGIPKNIEVALSHAQSLSAHSRQSNTAGLTLSHYHFNDYKRVGISHQIGILFGLPKVEFEAVLAHELLHVWQHENGVKFSPVYSEGLCELGGYLVYSEDSSELSRHFLDKMFKSKDPIYGNGFRIMQKKLERSGWPALIAEILRNKQGLEVSVLRKIFPKK
ncbi:MAG: protein DA1 [Deltaproteobacteria bacterium]|nr:protein DA1 [Deltaproteobacteria bacterium]